MRRGTACKGSSGGRCGKRSNYRHAEASDRRSLRRSRGLPPRRWRTGALCSAGVVVVLSRRKARTRYDAGPLRLRGWRGGRSWSGWIARLGMREATTWLGPDGPPGLSGQPFGLQSQPSVTQRCQCRCRQRADGPPSNDTDDETRQWPPASGIS